MRWTSTTRRYRPTSSRSLTASCRMGLLTLSNWTFSTAQHRSATPGNPTQDGCSVPCLLRSWCGDKLILGCGVPVMPAPFGIVDYCRIGCDVGLDWDDVWYMRLFPPRAGLYKAVHRQHNFPPPAQRACLRKRPRCILPARGKLQADPTAKADPGRVNALFSGILLTSDMPSRYTDEMRRQYNALRELTDHAENCTVDADDGLTVRTLCTDSSKRSKFSERSAFFKNTKFLLRRLMELQSQGRGWYNV